MKKKKPKTEFMHGQGARKRFEDTMKGLFRVSKSITASKKKGKD